MPKDEYWCRKTVLQNRKKLSTITVRKKNREQIDPEYVLGKKLIIPVLNTVEVLLRAGILRDTHIEYFKRYLLTPAIITGDSFNQESNVECVCIPLASSIHPSSRNSLITGYKWSGATLSFYQCKNLLTFILHPKFLI